MKPQPPATFFPSAAAFRAWLEKHHASAATELQIGFYKKSSGKPGLTYAEAVDEALCFGWIDGVVHRIDAESYRHRFTPRQRGSIWSNANIARIARLKKLGRMRPAGLAAFAARQSEKSGTYAFERTAAATLPPVYAKRFRAHARAWAFFSAQAPWYRRTAIHKILSAKREATRERWLARLIADSAAGRRLTSLSATSARPTT